MTSDLTDIFALAPAYPELALVIGAVLLLMIGVFQKNNHFMTINGLAIGLMGAVLVLLLFAPSDGVLFNGGFVQDEFSRFMKVLVLIGSIGARVRLRS